MTILFVGVLSILLLAVLVWAGGYLRFTGNAEDLVRRLFASADREKGGVVTADVLQPLPEPVQRYLTYTGVVGKPMPKTVWLKQEGQIRSAAETPWMAFLAEEYYTVSPPSFVWHAGVRMARLPLVRVRDSYADGRGNILVKAAGLYTMDDGRGEEMDQASLVRYLNEMMWFPAAFLGDNVSWEAVDDHSARVTLTDRGRSVSALMTFDDEGRFTNFVGPRYDISGDEAELTDWATPVTAYGQFEGLRLPVRGRGVWQRQSGDFTYIELEVTEIKYDVPAP